MLLLTAFMAGPAHAAGVQQNVIIQQGTAADLPNFLNRQQRLNFQQRQQINRELDSLSIQRQRPRIDVPVLKPGCRPRQVGNSYIAQTC